MKMLRNWMCVSAVVGVAAAFAPSASAGVSVDCTKYPNDPACKPPPPPSEQSRCNAGNGNGSDLPVTFVEGAHCYGGDPGNSFNAGNRGGDDRSAPGSVANPGGNNVFP